MSERNRLFSDGQLGASLDAERNKVGEAAAAIPQDVALSKSVDDLVKELVDRFTVQPLEIDWDAATVSHADAQIDVSGDPMRFISDRSRPFYMPGTTLTYHAPFTGDPTLFKLRPSTFTFNPPGGSIRGNELRISITRIAPIADNFKAELDGAIGQVKNWVGWANGDVAVFNAGLATLARGAVEHRRQKVLADQQAIASLGIPVRRKEDATPTYAVPPVRRKASHQTAQAAHSPRPPEPVLPAETYEEILRIIRNMATVMELSPKAFAGMGEEDLRTQFLVQLNGQYEGDATGETFNFEGKTDILIRRQGRNTFIGECKFWDGPKKLTATIDQLLGYTSWRDTKSAILLFNRGRELSHVLEQIAPTVRNHPNFVREVPYADETSFRFLLQHRDDPERELTLTILVFEVPA